MNIAEGSIKNKTITLVITALLVVGGIKAYQDLGRLEDPEFTIKEAQVFTRYPGATAMEVAEEVTDELETAIQQMGQLKLVTSISEPGLSTIRVEIKNSYDKFGLPQVWDELRRKVNDAQAKLPPGTSPSIVYDDFGDVFGVLFAIYGDGYSYAELKEHADLLRRELLICEDVGKITFFGSQQEVVYLEISRARLAQLGISPSQIHQTLAGQNLVADAGHVEVGSEYIRLQPNGEFTSVDDIGDLLIVQTARQSSRLYLRDLATIRRGYVDPPETIMHFNGHPAIGFGISTVLGGNVITMGEAVDKRLKGLVAETPIGIEVGVVAHQAQAVNASVNNFVVGLVEAILIVVGVLMVAMGIRSALLIGFILLLTVLATFVVMGMQGIMLERISLGALVIALGMLVDNAIVVVEGILINLGRGMDRIKAASAIVGQTMWPLFGATVVAVLAFAAIGASQDSTGEYCRSLFQVILISLMLSWVFAITVTPLFGVMFLKVNNAEGTAPADPYGGFIFQGYKAILTLCIRFRRSTLLLSIGLLVVSIYGFGFVKQSFFPPSTRPQFMMHYWLPQGTRVTRTEGEMKQISGHIRTIDGVTDVANFVGQGSPRFLLTYSPEEGNSAYGMFLVSVEDYRGIDSLIAKIQDYIAAEFPDATSFGRKFVLGPGDPAKIHARFRGYDADMLRLLADETKKIMLDEPTATDILDDWRQRVPMIRPLIAETQARSAGIMRAEVASALTSSFEGSRIGIYREGDDQLPIIARSPQAERTNVDDLNNVQIWSPAARRSIPIRQVVLGFETSSENTIVRRRDRLPTITVKCDPKVGEAAQVFQVLRPRIEDRFEQLVAEHNLVGYSLEWGGEYEDSGDAKAALQAKFGPIGVLIFLVVVCLFNSIQQPMMIFLAVPLAVIGVTAGLLLTGQPFGFMALLGFMSLLGMMIKNAIVLIDEINLQISEGKELFYAIVDSGVSRMRPVSMAALTTVLGMIPLLADAFFVSMAVTIMFGLSFATVLTLFVIPVLYATFNRVSVPRD